MGKAFSRQREVSSIHYFPSHPGRRAVFLVEARTRKEVRQITELFDMVGQLAEVVPISHGTVMSYAVQVQGDTTLFGKIEWLLKTQFSFSLVERSFNEVTFRLVQSLCEDSKTEMSELPECGICEAVDPFPTRATVELADASEPLHLAYCMHCTARHAADEPEQWILNLVSRDRARLKLPREIEVVVVPEMATHRPEEETDRFAIAI